MTRSMRKVTGIILLAVLLCLAGPSGVWAESAVGSEESAEAATAPEKEEEAEEKQVGYSDISTHWAGATLQQWVAQGKLTGYQEGVYRPDSSITRAEFFSLLSRSFAPPRPEAEEGLPAFQDIRETDWFYEDVMWAVAAGYVTGTGEGLMSPHRPIARQEAVVILMKAAGLEPAADPGSAALAADGTEAAGWAAGFLGAAVENGLMEGSQGRLFPQNNISRAEAVLLLDRAISRIRVYRFSGIYGPADGEEPLPATQIRIMAPDVTLQNMTTDTLLVEPASTGLITLRNVQIQGDLKMKATSGGSLILSQSTVGGVLLLSGGAEPVAVRADGLTLQALRRESGQQLKLQANVSLFENAAAGLKLELTGTIQEMRTVAPVELSGSGKIEKISEVSALKELPAGQQRQTTGRNDGANGGTGRGGGGSGSDATAVSRVEIDQSLYLNGSESGVLTCTIYPETAVNQSVIWSISNSRVAALEPNGISCRVTGLGEGSAEVKVTTEDGNRVATTEVTVVRPNLRMEITPIVNGVIEGYEFSEEELAAVLANGQGVDPGLPIQSGDTFIQTITGNSKTDLTVPIALQIQVVADQPGGQFEIEEIGGPRLTSRTDQAVLLFDPARTYRIVGNLPGYGDTDVELHFSVQ